ncbi:MAG: four helix bundle protein [FCB group bacterium]|jgi:four helix bundle protein
MKENIIQEKSFSFAKRIVKSYQFLTNKKKEFVLSKQLLRSGTSIGVNVEEAIGGQSVNDFISKISIAYKECRETKYWIKLLSETGYLTLVQGESLLKDLDELLKIITSIQKTSKNNISN